MALKTEKAVVVIGGTAESKAPLRTVEKLDFLHNVWR